MIEKLVYEIAADMSVPLSSIQLIDGCRLGIKGSYLLKMTVNDKVASTMIHQGHITNWTGSPDCERIGFEIRNAMCRLQSMLEK